MTAGASKEVEAFVAAVAADNRRRARDDGGFCKSYDVVVGAARTLGVWSEALGRCLDDEVLEWSEEAFDFYERFVAVVRAGVHLEGQGNFGDDESPAAHPKYNECRLTALGRQLLADQECGRWSRDDSSVSCWA